MKVQVAKKLKELCFLSITILFNDILSKLMGKVLIARIYLCASEGSNTLKMSNSRNVATPNNAKSKTNTKKQNRNREPVKTTEELDREMEEFMNADVKKPE
eukprot:NODE_58_length_25774_cov_0.240545.p12 type:complete len:101 gc:universal NODE_58_length_25774_cov_0.240545:18431-18733(+)